MFSITQAAILCGGVGTRLRPLTDTLPKPMAPVNGRPFLGHLIEQLHEQGITSFVLMTGYRGEQIEEYFGDGSSMGVAINYSSGPVEWETGRRLYEARSLLNERFMLLYSDNFVPFNLEKMIAFHLEKNRLLSLVVTPKKTGNIRINNDSIVEVYDKTRTTENLEYVELGYMITDKRIFGYYTELDVSFSNIIAKLVDERQVAGNISCDVYHSISDLERLALMEKYLAIKKILLIDRDGTINQKAPRGEYISSWEVFRFIDSTVLAMEKLSAAGYCFIVISNQAGIGRGVLKLEVVHDINTRMKQILSSRGINIIGHYLCPHHWEDHCFCRKPNPGLFFKASREHFIRLDKTYYIGDDPRDCQAAHNAGCKSIFLGPQESLCILKQNEQPHYIFKELSEAIPLLGAP